MRARRTDVDFSEELSFGWVTVERLPDSDRMTLRIEKTVKGNSFPGSLQATLDEAGARKLRDALDIWLRRDEPTAKIVDEPIR